MPDTTLPPGQDDASAPTPPFAAAKLRDYACAELARAITLLSRRGGRIHEGVHQARKSLRRTRATLALGGASLGPGAALIDREARNVNRGLSKLRDAQALIEVIDHLLRKTPPPEEAALLRRARRIAAKARAERAQRALTGDPALANRRALLTTLHAALLSLPWDALDANHVHAALAQSTLRVERAGERALASNRDEDWHRWRRRMRRLSQQHRVLAAAAPDLIVDRKRWKSLAVMLGESQDYALLRDHCGSRSPFVPADRRTLRAMADHGTRKTREEIGGWMGGSAATEVLEAKD